VSNAAAARGADSVRDASTGETAVAGINPGTTLQAVLSELARRQKLLDERRDPSAADARPPARESSNPPNVARADESRLDIGSIVVQVIPEPPPNPGPRAAKPRPTSAPDRRWARSFLDRST
jgi:hypothetical protein